MLMLSSPMRKGWKTFGTLVVALLACTLVAIFGRKPEPSYRGRKLSQWVALYSGGYRNPPSNNERPEAAEAIRHIGAGAVPWLLAWTDYEPPKLMNDLKQIGAELPDRLLHRQPVKVLYAPPGPPVAAEERAATAREAFAALGPLATAALPELVRRINATNSPFRRGTAMLALSHLGPPAVPTMTAVLSNPNQTADPWIKQCVGNLGTNARPLLSLLVQNLQQPNWRAAAVSASALGNTNFDPDLVVPALTQCLRHPRREVRMEAPLALMEFGTAARPALPALSNAVADASFDVRKNAIIAIEAIAPTPPTNGPPQ